MKKKSRIFSNEEIENIAGLCDVLQQIRTRLISEGISIEDIKKQLQEKEEKENKKG